MVWSYFCKKNIKFNFNFNVFSKSTFMNTIVFSRKIIEREWELCWKTCVCGISKQNSFNICLSNMLDNRKQCYFHYLISHLSEHRWKFNSFRAINKIGKSQSYVDKFVRVFRCEPEWFYENRTLSHEIDDRAMYWMIVRKTRSKIFRQFRADLWKVWNLKII